VKSYSEHPMPNADVIHDLVARRNEMRAWLLKHAGSVANEQAHLTEGSVERAYWTHGYQAALEDILARYATSQACCNAGKSSH